MSSSDQVQLNGGLPLVYAVILSWNRQDDTLECIESLLENDYARLRILVVDNASTDGTAVAIQERFPSVEVVTNDENLGFAEGNNVAIRYAMGRYVDYILLLNDDTVAAKDMVSGLVAVADTDPRIGVLTPKIYFHDDRSRIWSAGGARPLFMPGIKSIGFGKRDSPAYARQRDVDYTTACAVMVRATVFRDVGLFDPTYFMYHEDFDFSERVRRNGYRIVYVPQARVWHKEPLSTRNACPTRWYHLAKSSVPFCLRYSRLPYVSLTLYVGWLILRESVKGNFVAAKPCLRGMRDGLSDTIRN